MLYFNARSVCTKQTELRDVLESYDCDILGVTETWLNNSVKFSAITSDYQVFRQDREHGSGGGVMLVVKHCPCRLIKSVVVGRSECLFVDVRYTSSDYIRYCLIYRPPDTTLDESFELFDVIYNCLKNVKIFLLLGDFNLPDISWCDFTARSQASREFLTMCFKLGAEQCVNFPSRGDNMLDLVLTSTRHLITDIQEEPPFCSSDHSSMLCHLNSHTKLAPDYTSKPAFQKADYGLINAFLGTIDWSEVFTNCCSTEDYWIAFKDIINTAIYNFVPFVTGKKYKNPPWFNKHLKRLRNIKQKKWRSYRNSRNIVSSAEYKEAAGRFRTEFMETKRKFEKELFQSENTTGKLYGYVKSQTTVRSLIPSLKRSDGSFAVTDHEKACELSEYFSSVFVKDNNILPHFEYDCDSELNTFTCSTTDIVKVVRKLKTNSSPGPDGVSVYFIKNVLAQIAGPLSKVYRTSLAEGYVPDDWKSAFIVPIHKKGDQQRISNYRPVR